MRISILFFLAITVITPLSVHASEVRIPCNSVKEIEIRKTVPGMPVLMNGVRGSCKGYDCYVIGIRLNEKEAAIMRDQVCLFIGQPYDVYVGAKKMSSGIKRDFVPPVEIFSLVGEDAVYAEFEEAAARAIEICPDRPVRYAGILGERPKPD